MTAEATAPDDADDLRLHVTLEQISTSAKGSLWTHPLTKAAGAFVFTTLIGSFLTAAWQYGQWTEQQIFTARADRAKAQLEITKHATEKISDTLSSSNHLIFVTLLDLKGRAKPRHDAQLRASVDEWIMQDRTWRASESVILADVTSQFQSRRVHCLLRQILANRREISKQMIDFVETSRGEPFSEMDMKRRSKLEEINSKIYLLMEGTIGEGKLLSQLRIEMIKEMRETQEVKQPIWRRFISRL